MWAIITDSPSPSGGGWSMNASHGPYYHLNLKEFILPYEAVRSSPAGRKPLFLFFNRLTRQGPTCPIGTEAQ
jgi:hypothetical protein